LALVAEACKSKIELVIILSFSGERVVVSGENMDVCLAFWISIISTSLATNDDDL